MSEKLKLSTFYFCPNCGTEAKPPVSPVTHGGNATEAAKTEDLSRYCGACNHHWNVGTQSELERAVLLIRQASVLFGAAFAVVPPDNAVASHSMKWLRDRADELAMNANEVIDEVIPVVARRLPRP